MIVRKSKGELETMREGGKITAGCLASLTAAVKPGVTTAELDELADSYIRERGGTPEFKGFPGSPGASNFPASICASPNAMIVHGIPGPYTLREGDIISIDAGTRFEGFVSDSATTVRVGEVSEEVEALLRTTQECLEAATEKMCPGNKLGDVGHAIQSLAEGRGYGVIRDLVSHGVGRQMHEDPQIPNYGKPGSGTRLLSGMTFAIEPMISLGSYEIVLDEDGWSIYTADGSIAAHYEHTIAITDDGPWVLTAPPGE